MVMVANPRPLVYPARDCATTYGEHKAAWPTRREAQHVRRLRRVLDQHPYWCPQHGWHLGHRGRRA